MSCPFPSTFSGTCRPLFLLIVETTHIDIQPQTLRIQIHLVLARLLQDLSNVPGVLDPPQLNVTLALLDGLANQLGRAGFTLCADDGGLLLLASLVNKEGCSLGLLLSDLLRFDGGSKFGGKGKVLDKGMSVLSLSRESPERRTYGEGNIIQGDVEASSSPSKVVADESCDVLSLRDQLTGVELRNNALQHLIDD